MSSWGGIAASPLESWFVLISKVWLTPLQIPINASTIAYRRVWIFFWWSRCASLTLCKLWTPAEISKSIVYAKYGVKFYSLIKHISPKASTATTLASASISSFSRTLKSIFTVGCRNSEMSAYKALQRSWIRPTDILLQALSKSPARVSSTI